LKDQIQYDYPSGGYQQGFCFRRALEEKYIRQYKDKCGYKKTQHGKQQYIGDHEDGSYHLFGRQKFCDFNLSYVAGFNKQDNIED
jgi:hypothetical protein